MAITIPSSARLQPSDNAEMDESASHSISVTWKGPYSALMTAAKAIRQGDQLPSPYTGWYAKSWTVQKTPASYALLTISGAPADETTEIEPGGGGGDQVPLKDVWKIKAVRNDVSIMAYCSFTPGGGPQRTLVEKWMKEGDAELARNNSFRNPDGSITSIEDESPDTVALIEKIRKGVQSVIRFYPQITRERTYYGPPSDILDNLSYIDTPPAPPSNSLSSGGLASKIALYQWLKVDDGCAPTGDGKWVRSEAWIGILKTDGNNNSPWDPDLYGQNRWNMPNIGNVNG